MFITYILRTIYGRTASLSSVASERLGCTALDTQTVEVVMCLALSTIKSYKVSVDGTCVLDNITLVKVLMCKFLWHCNKR